MKALLISATGATRKRFGARAVAGYAVHPRCCVCAQVQVGNASQTYQDHYGLWQPKPWPNTFVAMCGSLAWALLKTAGFKAKQWHIDYDSVGLRNWPPDSVSIVLCCSPLMAPVQRSGNFWFTNEGKLEDAIKRPIVQTIYNLQAGALAGWNTNRIGERVASVMIKVLNNVGLASWFKPMPTDVVGRSSRKRQ